MTFVRERERTHEDPSRLSVPVPLLSWSVNLCESQGEEDGGPDKKPTSEKEGKGKCEQAKREFRDHESNSQSDIHESVK